MVKFLINCYDYTTLLDTAGQERFQSLSPMYYRGANAAIIAFSLVDRLSFESVEDWSDRLRNSTDGNLPFVLIGTKIDLREDGNDNHISTEEGRLLASRINAVDYVETSAKSNEGVTLAMESSIKYIQPKQSFKNEMNMVQIDIEDGAAKYKSAGCCGGGWSGWSYSSLFTSIPSLSSSSTYSAPKPTSKPSSGIVASTAGTIYEDDVAIGMYSSILTSDDLQKISFPQFIAHFNKYRIIPTAYLNSA